MVYGCGFAGITVWKKGRGYFLIGTSDTPQLPYWAVCDKRSSCSKTTAGAKGEKLRELLEALELAEFRELSFRSRMPEKEKEISVR